MNRFFVRASRIVRLVALICVAFLPCLIVSTAHAQSTTTFTGVISDLTGTPVTSGQVTFALKPSVDSTISGVARFTPQTVTCGIDGTGALKNQALSGACVVTSNTSLTPVGTYYKVTVCPAFACGPAFNAYALGGTTDITTVVPTPGTSPANMFLDLMSTQAITGAKTFNNAANSFSGTFAGTIAASSVTSSSTISSVGNGTIGGTITAGSAAHTITTAAGLLDLAQTSGTLAVSHGGTGVTSAPIPASVGGTGQTSLPLLVSNGGIGQTSLADGANIKTKRVTSCTTAASANATCDTTVTWTTAFADANYTPACSVISTSKTLQMLDLSTIPSAASMVVTIINAPGISTANSGIVNCIAIHD